MLVSKSDGITTEHENVRARDTNSFKKKLILGHLIWLIKYFIPTVFSSASLSWSLQRKRPAAGVVG